MRKRIVLPAIAVLCLVAVCGAALYLSYGQPGAPSRARVPGLEEPARLVVYEDGSAAIDAASARDAYAGLGYLHAQEHAWAMTLWQRTARGVLSPWLGAELLPIDRLARRLRIASMSQAAYAALDPDDRALLDAYAAGVNAALGQRRAGRSPEFVLLRAAPDPWEPWYALSIERLWAWLAAEFPHPDSLQGARAAADALDALQSKHRLLQEWLHLHGFDHSMAWAVADSDGTHLFQRQVYGASALPLFQEVTLTYPGETAIGATWIGAPFMPAGRTNARFWSILPASAVALRVSADDAPAFEYEKWTVAEGREVVTRFRRDEGALFLGTDSSAAALAAATDAPDGPDSAASNLYLTWPGWEPVSDAAAWFGLISGSDAPFALQDGDGLIATPAGSLLVAGTPLFAIRHGDGLAAGNNPWSALAAERLAASMANKNDPLNASESPLAASGLRSAWAENITSRILEALPETLATSRPGLFEDALTYLRNWDYSFDGASIPATIADAWAGAYFDSTGAWPGLPADSAASLRGQPEADRLEERILERAVAALAGRFGPNPERWRWENAHPHAWYFPVWSSEGASIGKRGATRDRYAPIRLPGSGHVTALKYGISRSEEALPAPARWEASISTSAWEVLRYRARRFPVHRPFGRYLVPRNAPRPGVLRADSLDETTGRAERPGRPVRYVTTLLPG